MNRGCHTLLRAPGITVRLSWPPEANVRFDL
jgi:hypothetical protein